MNSTSDLPNLGGSLEDWLERQMARHAGWFAERPVLLDIGAYHGDFARRLVGGLLREAILFEPNPENFGVLQKELGGDKRFRLEARACANQAGSATLHCQGERYTGSLLAYQNERPGPKAEHAVAVTTLDEFLATEKLAARVGMIKVDTQGNDLRVLQGAAGALRAGRPWLVVEMLATPRFVQQAQPVEVMQFLAGENYFLAAQFNEFYTATGWLAWYDACFVPQELFSMEATANLPRPTAAEAQTATRARGSLGRKLGRIFQAG
jgi:FkbM family methyltransferase